jgi:hypothetical protein
MKPYHLQGLFFVGVCLMIGVLLAIGSGFGGRQAEVATANSTRPDIQPQPPQATYAASQPTPQESFNPQLQPATESAGDGRGLAVLSPSEPQAGGGSDARSRAARFVYEYFAAAAGDPADAMTYASRTYAPTVQFYGQMKTVQQILAAKSQYMARWPQRSYRVEPTSVSTSCDEAGYNCVVGGIVIFECASPERGAVSRGTASFRLQLSLGQDQIAVTSEAGAVINRY